MRSIAIDKQSVNEILLQNLSLLLAIRGWKYDSWSCQNVKNITTDGVFRERAQTFSNFSEMWAEFEPACEHNSILIWLT